MKNALTQLGFGRWRFAPATQSLNSTTLWKLELRARNSSTQLKSGLEGYLVEYIFVGSPQARKLCLYTPQAGKF